MKNILPGQKETVDLSGRDELRNEYIEWITFLADWRDFITLTYRYDYVSPERAKNDFNRLLIELNKDCIGRYYTKKIGHSYFTYVLGMEYQKREVVHFHIISDGVLNYDLIHSWWGDHCGFSWIENVRISEVYTVCDYLTKYIVKGGYLEVFKSRISGKEFIYPEKYLRWE